MNNFSNFLKKKLRTLKKKSQRKVITGTRNTKITLYHLGKKIRVYNGKKNKIIYINNLKLGTKVGEYHLTRLYRRDRKSVV